MRVKIYRNLHRDCFSVVALSGPNKGRVVKHVDQFIVTNVEFRVSEAGRQRVLHEKRKNVHAFIVGNYVDVKFPSPHRLTQWEGVSYNPYRADTFFSTKTSFPVKTASAVIGYGSRYTIAFAPQ